MLVLLIIADKADIHCEYYPSFPRERDRYLIDYLLDSFIWSFNGMIIISKLNLDLLFITIFTMIIGIYI